MKDLFKEAEKTHRYNTYGPLYRGCLEKTEKLHRRVRHFLKQLLTKEVKEIENDSHSRK